MSKYPTACMTIGAIYVPTDGKFRILIDVDSEHLTIGSKGTFKANESTVEGKGNVDWGDGIIEEITTSNSAQGLTHTYATPGKYVISYYNCNYNYLGTGAGSEINGGCGTICNPDFKSSHDYHEIVKEIHCNSTYVGYGRSFSFCGLERLVIPEGVGFTGNYRWQNCVYLKCVVLPRSFTDAGGTECITFSMIEHISLPPTVTVVAAYVSRRLRSIAIPESVTSMSNIRVIAYASNCVNVTILPDTVTSYNGLGQDLYSLKYCYVSKNVTVAPYAIYAVLLKHFTLQSGITRLNGDFSGCSSLREIVIPPTVTSIGNSTFNGCRSMRYIKFECTTPPNVSNINAFGGGIPTSCRILVPRGTLEAYTSATNYPSSATYTYEEYD